MFPCDRRPAPGLGEKARLALDGLTVCQWQQCSTAYRPAVRAPPLPRAVVVERRQIDDDDDAVNVCSLVGLLCLQSQMTGRIPLSLIDVVNHRSLIDRNWR